MRLLKSAVMAFSTFTKIPMPQIDWDDDAVRVSIAFLPMAGAVLGGVIWLWIWLCGVLDLSAVLFAAVAAVLPVLFTGGIHLDGFCDTVDALSSWQDRERKLEIMKDPHIGTFAMIRCVMYLLICFALLYELRLRGLAAGLGFIYLLSRCFAAFGAITLPNARKSGMLMSFTESADRRAITAILAIFAVAGMAGLIWFASLRGVAALVLGLLTWLWYRLMAMKQFSGATGDTTGFSLQAVELALLAGLLVGGFIR